MKKHTTFIQLGNLPAIPIPFWMYVAIMRIKHLYALSKVWVLRKVGKVYDPGRGLTKRPPDLANVPPHCEHGYNGLCPICDAMQTPPSG